MKWLNEQCMRVRIWVGWLRIDSSTGFDEHSNGSLDSIKGGEYLDHLDDHQFSKDLFHGVSY
jgi:hypothetical protein